MVQKSYSCRRAFGNFFVPECFYCSDKIEVTWKEVLFCVFMFGIMLTVGFEISYLIKTKTNDLNLKYNQAIGITGQSEFEQAYNTSIGYAFVQGHFECDGVEYESISGRYLSIKVTHERYTQHTRTETYTVTDSKGGSRIKTRTVHYWTWDAVGSESRNCPIVEFKGKKFSFDSFDFSNVPVNTTIAKTGFHRRDVIKTMPSNFDCTVFCNLGQKRLNERAIVFYKLDVEQARKAATANYANMLFWMVWLLLSGGICVWFVAFPNNWLNKSKK